MAAALRHLLWLAVLSMMSSMMMTTVGVEGGHFNLKRYLTRAEFSAKLWELRVFLQKLAQFVGYPDLDHVPFGYLQHPYQQDSGYPAYQGQKPVYQSVVHRLPYYTIDYGYYANGQQDGSGRHYVAFLGKACLGKPFYDLLTSSGVGDTAKKRRLCGCVSLQHGYIKIHGHSYCKDHYKSSIAVDWENDHIVDKVRVSVYNNGHEAMYMVFNGTGSTPKDFFAKDRLLYSPYTDLGPTTHTNYFSAKGHLKRRFFINKDYGGYCKKDIGWHVMLDGLDPDDRCKWVNGHDCYPQFLYSAANTSQAWNSGDIKKGDMFVISVTLNNKASYHKYSKVVSIQHCQ